MEILDINGMYQWDKSIFDNMQLPTDIDKPTLIDMIIWECRELTLTVLSPAIIKRAIELWSKANIYYWDELQKTMHYTYNPIENYDKHSTITTTYGSTDKLVASGDVTNTQTGKKTTNQKGTKTTTQKGTKTTNQKGTETTTDALTVSAFDSSSLEPRETHTITRDLGIGGMNTTEDFGVNGMSTTEDYGVDGITTTEDFGVSGIVNKTVPNTTDTTTHTGQDVVSDETHGNIGVRSSQELITQQRDIINISLYNVIVNSFKNEFCILKY